MSSWGLNETGLVQSINDQQGCRTRKCCFPFGRTAVADGLLQNLKIAPAAAQVLKYETERQPGKLGASVAGYNDAYARLAPLLRRWRALAAETGAPGAAAKSGNRRHAGGGPPMYLVSADVSRAFDNVDIEKLLAIAEPLLRSAEYTLVKHVEVRGPFGQPQS